MAMKSRAPKTEEIPGVDVTVVAESALTRVGDGAGSGKIVLCVERSGIEHDLVMECWMYGTEGERQVLGPTIAAND